ncbi:oleate hydratase [Streptomyces sp. NPDC056367]|uniref:oleate hydratase n=1 Tax=Streptomyces sp. NPDC056367 TaxID=3345797 RepID=UPI0035D84765
MSDETREPRAYPVGGGIASPAAAVCLAGNAGMQGWDIRILEEPPQAGGAPDGGGAPGTGCVTRGGRTVETARLPALPASVIGHAGQRTSSPRSPHPRRHLLDHPCLRPAGSAPEPGPNGPRRAGPRVPRNGAVGSHRRDRCRPPVAGVR